MGSLSNHIRNPASGGAENPATPVTLTVVDATGRIMREAKVASEPEALVRFFRELGGPLTRIGLETGPLSQWLHAGLTEAGFEAVLLRPGT